MASRSHPFYASARALLSRRSPAFTNALTTPRRMLPLCILAIVVAFCDIERKANCTLLNRQTYSYLLPSLYRNLVFRRKWQIGLFERSILEQTRYGKMKAALRFVQTFRYIPTIEIQCPVEFDLLKQIRGLPGVDEDGNHLFPNLRKASLNIYVNNGAFDLEDMGPMNLTESDNERKNNFLSRVRMLSLNYLACYNAGELRVPLKYLGLGKITSIQVKPALETGPYPDIFRLFQDAYYLQSITVDLREQLDPMNRSSLFLRQNLPARTVPAEIVEMIRDFIKLSTIRALSLRELVLKIRSDQAYFQNYAWLALQNGSEVVTQVDWNRVKWDIDDSQLPPLNPRTRIDDSIDECTHSPAAVRSRCITM